MDMIKTLVYDLAQTKHMSIDTIIRHVYCLWDQVKQKAYTGKPKLVMIAHALGRLTVA
jgi:hypothetical protein